MANLKFPSSFPEKLKPLAERHYEEFKQLVCRKKKDRLECYQRFIADKPMPDFWGAVAKLPLTLTPENNKENQVIPRTADSVFATFNMAFISWFTRPTSSKKNHTKALKRAEKILLELGGICNSSQHIKSRLDTYFIASLNDIPRTNSSFSTVTKAMAERIRAAEKLDALAIEYHLLPKRYDRSHEADLQKTHFQTLFQDIVRIAYGKNHHAEVIKISACVMPEIEIDYSAVAKSSAARKKRESDR